MRDSIIALINSGVTSYRISKDTGITLSIVQKIMDGTSNLDNISLKNAELLAAYSKRCPNPRAVRNSIQALIRSNYKPYHVAVEAEIPPPNVLRIFVGSSKLDNISLKNAEKLAAFWDEATALSLVASH